MRILFLLLLPLFAWSQADIPVIDRLDIDAVPPGTIQKYWLHLADNGLSQPLYAPVMVARGAAVGPVLGLVAAIHGNELNGIPIIQRIFEELDPAIMRGTQVGVPGLNIVAIPLDQRRFIDGEDLNRLFPGRPDGDVSSQYVHRLFGRLIRHFDYLVDMHAFGDILKEYFAPEDGVVIGKSTNPVNMNGGRIQHLGVLTDEH